MTNLATDLDGQGANLNKLIASAAGTVQLLANKGDDLGQLNGTLAQLTGTLDTDTSQIEQLVEQYDTVSTTVAQHSGQLNDAITQLAGASSGLVSLLVPNLQPLEADVGTVTTVGRTLDRNLSSVDEILQNGNNLFQGAKRAYDPNYNWLDLNLATAPGVTGAYIAGLLRDRLAGICRRIVANHSSGSVRRGDRHLEPVRQSLVGILRPAAQRHPDHPQHPERGERRRHRPVAPPAGPDPDLQRRAGLPGRTVGARRADARPEEPGLHHHHHDHDRAEPTTTTTTLRSPRRRSSVARGARARFWFGCELVGRFGLGARWLAVEPGRPGGEASHGDPGRGHAVDVHDQRRADADRPGGILVAPAAPGPGHATMRMRTVGFWRAGCTTWRGGSDARPDRPALGARRLVLLPLLAALVVALTGCSVSGGGGQRTATAVFTDVGDLANGAEVQMADVPVGSVRSIALDGDKAKVTLAFDNGVRIPADVSAAIDRTTILGDQFVAARRPQERDGRRRRGRPAAGRRGPDRAHLPGPRRGAVRGGRVGGLRRHLHHGARADH